MFESVNKAYEFLCSKSKITDGPDPQNIVLILKAQCILFSRYREGRVQCYNDVMFVISVLLHITVAVFFEYMTRVMKCKVDV